MASFLGLDLTKNISYYTIPVALVACLVPHVLAVTGAKGTFDNANPRTLKENLEKSESLDKEVRFHHFYHGQQLRRRGDCPSSLLWSVLTGTCLDQAARRPRQGRFRQRLRDHRPVRRAVVAANTAGVDITLLNRLTIGYVLSRFAFIFVYVQLGGNRKTAPVRSLTWFAGISAIITLFITAGNKVAA
ncbi:Membrane associated eicosanoid glutathione metabolism-like domain [Cordyceps militaris]|uniref:Membrane associated eicosanoid glutathione metabolism-like domain n=1 Tax=Cordyceps militaris TaxID=73501 RepID=A0A2H4SBM3_CORMI|nr:Membrane associated eicosanoid glutathione metabolism-like domain [Cordyceps militaris]